MLVRLHSAFFCLLIAALAFAGSSVAHAGGGPENVFLVVNSASWASQTVANHYIQLRQIPPLNVFYLDWTGGFDTVEGAAFRERILVPTLETIERRGLLGQIDYVIYSSDFPSTIDMTVEFSGTRFGNEARPICSINSATFLWHLVIAKVPQMMDAQINHYMRLAANAKTVLPSHGFRSWYGWSGNGDLIEAGGQPYLLSTMLAVTSGRGNSVSEAIAYLRASASADGTNPKGTIYYSNTPDVRSTTRVGGFAAAVADLGKLGVKAEIITTAMPADRKDVQGAMTGIADYSWARSRSKILPGAICENFTSFGGMLGEGNSQTPLTEFLRYGAAGSSGTVLEPYSFWFKFPAPAMQVHYARGCSLAESYYQSVFSPAQLLIVGDPLCQPWAKIPKVQINGVKPEATVSRTLLLKPEATFPGGLEVDHFELFVDGRRNGRSRPGETLSWDSTTESDGFHQLCMVAVDSSAIETQGRTIVPIKVDNKNGSVALATMPAKTARWDETLKIRAQAAGMTEIMIHGNGRELGKISGEKGELEINPRQLGAGPVKIYAIATTRGATRTRAAALPVSLAVEPNVPLPALTNPPQRLADGLVLKLPNGKIVPVQDTRDPDWLGTAGLEANQPYLVQAFFDIPATDIYQFQLWHYGDLKLTVDGKVLYDGKQGEYTHKFAAAAMAVGKHRLTLSGRSGVDPKLRVLFGGPGALSLNGRTFRHARSAN